MTSSPTAAGLTLVDPMRSTVALRLVDETSSLAPFEEAARLNAFSGRSGSTLVVSGHEGPVALVGMGSTADRAAGSLRALSVKLPAGDYRLERGSPVSEAELALAWARGARSFDRYKHEPAPARARLAVEAETLARVAPLAEAFALAADLIDTPANDMGPAEIEAAARALGERFGAKVVSTIGEALLTAGFPAVHAVGRAAADARAPRMIELDWTGPGGADGPRLVLVGKGVSFDTGGLDLKPSAGMRLMKKDMGGSAHALALASLVMAERLPVRLRVLIPAVENAVSAEAMRPGDVLSTRKGLSVEVGNTDAEGRLILADALALAAEAAPDLTIDFATLTGAARVALGPQVTPFYTDDRALADEIDAAASATGEGLWRMPLWGAYDDALASEIADLKNDSDAWAQAGSITAALFLRRFAPTTGAWVHLDIFGWNPRAQPGRPVGGEAQTLGALHRLLTARYGARA